MRVVYQIWIWTLSQKPKRRPRPYFGAKKPTILFGIQRRSVTKHVASQSSSSVAFRSSSVLFFVAAGKLSVIDSDIK